MAAVMKTSRCCTAWETASCLTERQGQHPKTHLSTSNSGSLLIFSQAPSPCFLTPSRSAWWVDMVFGQSPAPSGASRKGEALPAITTCGRWPRCDHAGALEHGQRVSKCRISPHSAHLLLMGFPYPVFPAPGHVECVRNRLQCAAGHGWLRKLFRYLVWVLLKHQECSRRGFAGPLTIARGGKWPKNSVE